MPGVSALIDPMPDTDSFLPRYLTVQLLEILTEVLGAKSHDPVKLSARAEQFVAGYKNKELFTPVTYSIFWHDNVDQTLEHNTESLDNTDKYNRAALTIAIANEDFALARKLIDKGATLLLEDKLVLEIALTSMIQRDPTVVERILSMKTKYDMGWILDYLKYLYSYVVDQPIVPTIYHELLNPPIRNFGQVLDTLAFFNGFTSHYGFLSPSIEILTAHLSLYINDVVDNEARDIFGKISQAFTWSHDVSKFYGNLPTNEGAANIIAKQIATNIHGNNKTPVIVFGGFAGNAINIAFINKYLIVTNLGIGGTPAKGTKIFAITQPEAITVQAINTFLRGLGDATDPNIVLGALGEIVDPNPIYSIKQSFNPVDNCIFVNPRAMVEGLLLVLKAFATSTTLASDNLATAEKQIADLYQNYVNSLQRYSVEDLTTFMRNDELLQNKRIECCALAIDYINQHYKEPGSLENCLALKNALEYVGLKSFYESEVVPEAHEAIRNLMIQQQEAAALKVIEFEQTLPLEQTPPPREELPPLEEGQAT
jgi:hypothetical protein